MLSWAEELLGLSREQFVLSWNLLRVSPPVLMKWATGRYGGRARVRLSRLERGELTCLRGLCLNQRPQALWAAMADGVVSG